MRNSTSIEARNQHGFTLIELSIVLVIIGLIVGGILTGQSLIKQAQMRGTLTMMTRINTGVNTFRDKFGGLPGDLTTTTSAGLSNASNSTCLGDTLIDTIAATCTGASTGLLYAAESGVFFAQLYQAGITTDFYNITMSTTGAGLTTATGMPSGAVGVGTMPTYMIQVPYAPGGKAFYLWVGSGVGSVGTGLTATTIQSHNYYHLGNFTAITTGGAITDGLVMPPADAAGLDAKLDDGVPQTGTVLATNNAAGNTNAGLGDMILVAGATGCVSALTAYNTNAAATGGQCSMAIAVGF